MKKQFYCLSVLAALFVSLPQAYAQTPSKGGSVADLAFITGQWKAAPEGRSVEASWLPPSGGNVAGFMRMMKEGKVTMYELLAYEQTGQGLVSLVKHFQPGMIGQEELDKPVQYNFLEAGKDRVVFEQTGQGVRVLYEKRSADAFVISIGKEEAGKWVFKPLFEFTRVK
jgi:hypothetical protein